MQFGRVNKSELGSIDFSMPKDHADNRKVLVDRNGTPAIYIGCTTWNKKEWIGKIYHVGTKEKDFLTHYSTHFGCVEMNATHYRVFPQSTIEKWSSMADAEFRFCPKFTNSISHYHRLQGAHEETLKFYEQIDAFGGKLGPAFLQLHDSFGPPELVKIENYLESLPKHIPVFLELRSPEWFQASKEMDELTDVCRHLGIGFVITDVAGRRDVLHMRLTTSTAFVRFVGNNLHETDFQRIDLWVERITKWANEGLKELYFFIHMHDEKESPVLAHYFVEQLNKSTFLNVKVPRLIHTTGSLF